MAFAYYETGSFDPCYNLAFEEFLLKNKIDEDILMLWQNDNTIVVGVNQNTAEEINASFVNHHGINVVRRITGGGAVYHDLGNLNYSFITDCKDMEKLSIAQFAQPVCVVLSAMGVHAELSGRNDLLVDGKKISGVAQKVYKGRVLHHGTLLFDSDSGVIASALQVDMQKFRSKSSKSVRSRVGNIKDFLAEDMALDEFKTRFLDEFEKVGLRVAHVTEMERAQICELADTKYRSWDWTYGKNPPYNYHNRARYCGGMLDVKLMVQENLIENVCFSGDYMAIMESKALEAALVGCRLERNSLFEVMGKFLTSAIFGDITVEEVIETMLPNGK